MSTVETKLLNPTLRGAVYRQTHAATVQGVLADLPEKPPQVSSRGTAFYNRDRWTLRLLTFHLCKWAAENPGCVITKADLVGIVNAANNEQAPVREIVIANTPDELSTRMAMALTGGAYHEAWHTRYDCRRSLRVDEVAKLVLPRWAKIPNWAAIHDILQDWTNIVADIRIERLGCKEFPGSPSRMADLQDLILDQEANGFADARRHAVQAGVKPEAIKRGDLSIVTGAFRDKGLGYKTRTQQIAWQGYVAENPEAVKMVTEGPLAPLLDEAIHLGRHDIFGPLRVAMDVVVILVQQSGKQDQQQQDRDEAKDGQQGDGEQKCNACGAPAHKLVVRPKSDGQGGKVKGVGVCTCTVCGHQEEVKVKASYEQKNRDQQLKDAAKGPGPKWEGWDPEDFDQQNGQQGAQDGEQDKEGKGGAQGKGEDEEGQEGAQGGGSGADGDEDGDEQEGSGAGGSDGGEDGDEPQPGEGDNEGWSDNYTNATGQQGGKDAGKTPNNSKQKTASDGLGDDSNAGNDWSKVAAGAYEDAEQGKGTGLKDGNTALGEVVGDAVEKENGAILPGEMPYSPWDPEGDEVVLVGPSSRGKTWDAQQAENLLASVRGETSYLRARLANLFRALEQTDIVHGTRYGDDLSEPFLVDTALDLRAGVRPQRAYYQKDETLDTSMAACIVLDESGSMADSVIMGGRRVLLTEVATRVMIAITEPLDRLGIPVQVTGFRNGNYYGARHPQYQGSTLVPPEKGRHHRTGGHITDVFKDFGERFNDVKWRFANTKATGGTPMADGIQFALDSLNYRNEGHRVIFVVTDGCPSGNTDVINWQLRIAKEAGILVIGVGLGEPAKYVKGLFPDHVWSNDFSEFPRLLLDKLNQLIDHTASKRGQRMDFGV